MRREVETHFSRGKRLGKIRRRRLETLLCARRIEGPMTSYMVWKVRYLEDVDDSKID